MRKNIKSLMTLAIVLGLIMLNTVSVYAANVTALNVSGTNNRIAVSGTTDAGVLACAILVYDSTGTNLVAMETCAASSGAYSYTLTQSFAAGTYMVKVADYNGGDYATANVTVTGTTTVAAGTTGSSASVSSVPKSPKTGESTIPVILIAFAGCIAGFTVTKLRKKN